MKIADFYDYVIIRKSKVRKESQKKKVRKITFQMILGELPIQKTTLSTSWLTGCHSVLAWSHFLVKLLDTALSKEWENFTNFE